MLGMGMRMFRVMMRRRKPIQRCARCGLLYPLGQAHCPHCHGLSRVELEQLKESISRQSAGIGRLGVWMLLATGFGLLLLVLLLLYRR